MVKNYRGIAPAWLAFGALFCLGGLLPPAGAAALQLGELSLAAEETWLRGAAEEERAEDSLILRRQWQDQPLEVFIPMQRAKLRIGEERFLDHLEAKWRQRYGDAARFSWLEVGGIRWRVCRRPSVEGNATVFQMVAVRAGEAYLLVAMTPAQTEAVPEPVRALLAHATWLPATRPAVAAAATTMPAPAGTTVVAATQAPAVAAPATPADTATAGPATPSAVVVAAAPAPLPDGVSGVPAAAGSAVPVAAPAPLPPPVIAVTPSPATSAPAPTLTAVPPPSAADTPAPVAAAAADLPPQVVAAGPSIPAATTPADAMAPPGPVAAPAAATTIAVPATAAPALPPAAAEGPAPPAQAVAPAAPEHAAQPTVLAGRDGPAAPAAVAAAPVQIAEAMPALPSLADPPAPSAAAPLSATDSPEATPVGVTPPAGAPPPAPAAPASVSPAETREAVVPQAPPAPAERGGRWQLRRTVLALPARPDWDALAAAERRQIGADALVQGIGLARGENGLAWFLDGFTWQPEAGQGESRRPFSRRWRVGWPALPTAWTGGEALPLALAFGGEAPAGQAGGEFQVRFTVSAICAPQREIVRVLDDLEQGRANAAARLEALRGDCLVPQGAPPPVRLAVSAREREQAAGGQLVREAAIHLPAAWESGIRAQGRGAVRRLLVEGRFMASEAADQPGDVLLRPAALYLVFVPDV